MSDATPAEIAERRKQRRRAIGVGFIAVSVLMLILGNFPLEPLLRGTDFVLYWGICFLFALMALCTAVVDMIAVRHDAERERRRLVDETLHGRKRNEQLQNGKGNGGE